jgi:hypothetical protein
VTGGHAPRAAFPAVGDREFGLQPGVLIPQSLVLGAEGLEALVQGRLVRCGTNVVRAA